MSNSSHVAFSGVHSMKQREGLKTWTSPETISLSSFGIASKLLLKVTHREAESKASQKMLKILAEEFGKALETASDPTPDSSTVDSSTINDAALFRQEASTVTENTESDPINAPMDIYHPDFWNFDFDSNVINCSSEESSASSTSTNSDPLDSIKKSRSKTTRCSKLTSTEDVLTEALQSVGYLPSLSDPGLVVTDEDSITAEIADASELIADYPDDLDGIQRPALAIVDKVNTAKSTSKTRTPRVSFGKVTIRSYERIMCDHPSCSSGPSIGIGWTCVSEESKAIDDWEVERRWARRRHAELILSREVRQNLLLQDLGYKVSDVANVIREINKAKSRRRRTITNLSAQRSEEMVEAARSRLKKVLTLAWTRV